VCEGDEPLTYFKVRVIKEEKGKMIEDMSHLRQEIYELQQHSRRENLEIKGLPWTQGEDIMEVLQSVARAIQVPFNKTDVSAAHRMPNRNNGHPLIVVKFVSRQSTALWLAAVKKRRLTTADVSPHLQPGPVYVNAHLTVHNKRLLGRARAMFHNKTLAAAWATDDGKVMVKRTEGARAVRVCTMEDLDNM